MQYMTWRHNYLYFHIENNTFDISSVKITAHVDFFFVFIK